MLSQTSKPDQKRIIWKQWRGRAPIAPWVLSLFSIPLILVGASGLALGSGVFPVILQMPRWIIIVFGLYFLFGGLIALFFALQPGIRRAKLSNASPYSADYAWSAEVAGEDMELSLGKTVQGMLGLGGILPLMHIIAWLLVPEDEIAGRILVFGFLGLFDLILLAYIQQLVGFGLHRLRFGQTQVRFGRFPFLLGQRLQVTFEGDRQLSSRRMLATLRCIEETCQSTRYDPEAQIVCLEVYTDNSEFVTDGAGRAEIAFPLPEYAPGTNLNKDLPTYWELVVESILPEFGYKRVFLMPVYKEQT